MNLLTYRQPTHVYRSDACEHTLGGISALWQAWRWLIPVHLRSRAHINLLEFFGNIVYISVKIIDKAISTELCLLSMGDSTSEMGWMQKSNFTNDDKNDTNTIEKLACARHLARIVQESFSRLYTQWFHSKDNDVSDSLLRDHHLSTSVLANLLSSIIPHQLSPDFNIAPLPSVIDSWL